METKLSHQVWWDIPTTFFTVWNAFIDFSLDDDLENGDKLKVSEYKTLEVSALLYQGYYYYYCFFFF